MEFVYDWIEDLLVEKLLAIRTCGQIKDSVLSLYYGDLVIA